MTAFLNSFPGSFNCFSMLTCLNCTLSSNIHSKWGCPIWSSQASTCVFRIWKDILDSNESWEFGAANYNLQKRQNVLLKANLVNSCYSCDLFETDLFFFNINVFLYHFDFLKWPICVVLPLFLLALLFLSPACSNLYFGIVLVEQERLLLQFTGILWQID